MKLISASILLSLGLLGMSCSHTPSGQTSSDLPPPPWMNGVEVRAAIAPPDPAHPPELELHVTVKNNGREPVSVVQESPVNANDIELTTDDGEAVPRTEEGDRMAAHREASGQEVQLKPGETFTEDAPLSRIFRLNRPGRYHASVSIWIVNQSNTESWQPKSNVVTFYVQTR